jgi:hypothetical protein
MNNHKNSQSSPHKPVAPFHHELDCWTWGGWETDRMYRRAGGNRSTLYFGNGEWLNEWRQRLSSDETLDMMREGGITISVTYFYKGFGIAADSSEWPRLREYVAKCHQHGIKVWGYLQGKSLYRETFLAERPEAINWIAKQYDGSDELFGGAYYRVAPCITSAEYLNYMREVMRIGLEEIGLDGMHLDNSYFQHCYCARCKKLFREFLNEQSDLEKQTGLTITQFVEPPPIPRNQEYVSDPLQLLWMEFGVQNRLRFVGMLYRHLKALNPDAVFHTNPGFPRQQAYKLRLLDPSREGAVCDFMCAESSNLPRMENGVLYSQAEAYLYGDACGYRVLNTSWRKSSGGSEPAGTPALFWTGLSEEFSHGAAILGNNWLLRSAGNGPGVLGDNAAWREAHAAGVRFFQGLHRELKLGGRRQWAEAAIFINPDTMTQAFGSDFPAFRALHTHLLASGVPVCFVMDNQPIPDSVSTLLVCQQSCLTEEQMQRIAAFAAAPGHSAWIAGSSGRFDEWNIPRNESHWRAWRNSPGFVNDSGSTLDWSHGAGQPVPPQAAEQIDAFLQSRHWQPQFAAVLPAGVLVNTESTQDGRLLIHLRDQSGSGQTIEGVQLRLGTQLINPAGAKLYRAGNAIETETLGSTRADGETSTFIVPKFNHYALVVIPLA